MLVVRGEAGVGKTALLEHIAERSSGCRVVRVGALNLRWSSHSRVCINCARPSSAGWMVCRVRSAMLWGRRSGWGTALPESFPGGVGGPESAGGGG